MPKLVTRYVTSSCCALALSVGAAVAKNNEGHDKEPVEWLLQQIALGEAKEDEQLVIDSLDRLMQVAPEQIEAKAAYVRYLLDNNETQKALALYLQIERDFPKQRQTKLVKLYIDLKTDDALRAKYDAAKLMARSGNIKQAIKEYDAIFAIGFPTPAYEFEYFTLLSREDAFYNKAKKGLASLVKRYPGIIDYEIQYARLVLGKNPSDKVSLATLRKYATNPRYKNEIEALWLNALEQMPLNKHTRTQYDYFLSLFPASNQGRLQRDNFRKEYAAYQKLLADPGYQAYLSGKKYLAKDDLVTAQSLFAKSLKTRPNDPDVLGEMGRTLMRMGKHFDAVDYFKRAAKFAKPEDSSVWLGLAKTAQFWGLIAAARTQISNNEFSQAEQSLSQAKALNEDNETVLAYTADLLLAQGEEQKAVRIYQQLLRIDPNNNSALRGLVRLITKQNNIAALDNLANSLTKAQYKLVEEELTNARISVYKQRAEEKASRGEVKDAINLLSHAPSGKTPDPWLYYQLAKYWQRIGNAPQGASVFSEIVWRYPLNGELRYAQALYLNSIDQPGKALEALQYVPTKDKTDKIKQFEAELAQNDTLADVNKAIEQEQYYRARALLNDIERNDELSASLKARIASAWYKLGEQERAISTLESALKQDPTLAPYWHLQLGEWLLASKNTDKINAWFANSHLVPISSNDDKFKLSQLTLEYQLINSDSPLDTLNAYLAENPTNMAVYARLVTLYIEVDEFDKAQALLQQAHQYGEFDSEYEYSLIEQAIKEDEIDFTEYLTAHLANRVDASDSYLLQRLMTSLNAFDDADKALNIAKNLVALRPFDNELLKRAGDVAEHFDRNEVALGYYQRVIGESQLQSPNEPWYVGSARSGITRIKEKTDGHIAIAADFSGQTSTQSDSQLGLGAALFESYFPLFDGHGFVKVDNVSVLAQTTDFSSAYQSARYGTGYLCYPFCQLLSIKPQDRGTAFGIGWQNDSWRVDIGTTPQGFLLNDWVGGVLFQSSLGDFSFDIEVEKRALNNSVLAYAGMEDVTLDKVWGGVMQQGATLGVYHDLGEELGFWGTLDYQQYTGLNVKDNARIRAMGGAYYRFIQEQNLELAFGSNLMYWGYDYNLSQETFGHGGYYSPQSYYGISFPVTLDGRWQDKLVYRLKLGLGYSVSQTETIDFFPNNPELQEQAWQLAVNRDEAPVFIGETSSGISYSLQGLVEYQLAPKWLIGASFNLDRAELYEPNYAQLYLKYVFNPIVGPLPLVPKPITPYVNF